MVGDSFVLTATEFVQGWDQLRKTMMVVAAIYTEEETEHELEKD